MSDNDQLIKNAFKFYQKNDRVNVRDLDNILKTFMITKNNSEYYELLLNIIRLNTGGDMKYSEFYNIFAQLIKSKDQSFPIKQSVSTVSNVKTVPSAYSLGIAQDQLNVLEKVFNYFDADKSGTVSGKELDKILRSLNIRISDVAFNDLMRDIDRNNNGQMDFAEFCKLMAPVINGKFDDEDLYFAFKKFDTDGSGRLSTRELQQVMAKIGQNYSEREINEMISNVNNRNDGTITFDEFKRLIKSPNSTKKVPVKATAVTVNSTNSSLVPQAYKPSQSSFVSTSSLGISQQQLDCKSK
jgi:Ca2+-binding EF-hand superfamily protein